MTDKSTTTFTYTDPRLFDGNPYEVAEKATNQALSALRLAGRAMADAKVLVRNSYLQRQIDTSEDGGISTPFDKSGEGRAWESLLANRRDIERRLPNLAKAAGYDPAHPPLIKDEKK